MLLAHPALSHSSAAFGLCFAERASLFSLPALLLKLDVVLQVDVFSFGVVIYELLIRQVTSAVVSQSGDANLPQMYANKASLFASCFFWLPHLTIIRAGMRCHQQQSTCCILVENLAVYCAQRQESTKELSCWQSV